MRSQSLTLTHMHTQNILGIHIHIHKVHIKHTAYMFFLINVKRQ